MLCSSIYNAYRSHQSLVHQAPRIGQIRSFGTNIIASYLKANTKTKLESSQSYQLQSFPQSFGQPTHRTHPHLIKEGELVPGLNANEFVDRRQNLMRLLFADTLAEKKHDKHQIIVIIPAATRTYMSEVIPYCFRQYTDFLYLSGCLEPDSALILEGNNTDDFIDFTSTLLLRRPDAHSALWEGPRTGIDVAPEMFGVDEAYYFDQFKDCLNYILMGEENKGILSMYYDDKTPLSTPLHEVMKEMWINCPDSYEPATLYFHKLRAIKSPAEQDLMRKACEISSEAIKKAIKYTKPGQNERHLCSIVNHECRMLGAQFLAYPPVVAAGNNATKIHCVDNNQQIQESDLVLMDAGCEYHGYCADITRTWPASGKFNNYQRILYEIVLEVQKKILSLCDDRLSLDAMHFKMVHLLGEYLSKEKIIKKDVISSVEKNRIASDLCPHRVSHYLGMDVHDVASYPKNVPLQPGMVVTVEPGLYIKENDENVSPEFWKTGIRIEDDVLITDTGYEVLSAKCPKEIDDIENLMKS